MNVNFGTAHIFKNLYNAIMAIPWIFGAPPALLLTVAAFVLCPEAEAEDMSIILPGPAGLRSTLHAYVATTTNYQYGALAILVAAVIHLNLDAQIWGMRLVPQILGALSAFSALISLFLQHLITHSFAIIACSEKLTTALWENMLERHVSAWPSISRILTAPKRMLSLSVVLFAAYRLADVFVPSDSDVGNDGRLCFLLSITAGFAALAVVIYAAVIANAFARLT